MLRIRCRQSRPVSPPVVQLKHLRNLIEEEHFTMPEMVQELICQPGGLSQVPSRFVQPVEERPQLTGSLEHAQAGIPIIDMKGVAAADAQRREHVVAEIARACEQWGFFQVINHGVAPSLMEGFRDVACEFFSLSQQEKEEYAVEPGMCVGYGRFYEASDGVANWADNLILFSYGDEHKLANPCMPAKPERFREIVDKYGRSVFELFILLMELVSVGMGLEPDAIAKQANINRGTGGAAIRTDLNLYPPCPQPDLVLGSAPHADRSILTVLQQNQVSGLEVFKDGNWVRVPPIKNAFVINLGDQMQIMTNGTYQSVLHRAVTNHAVERYSFANFLVPADETCIQPIGELLSASSPPLYRAVSFGEYTGGNSYLFKPLEGKRRIDAFLVSA
ncbi:hypothetical protein KC19_3G015600 [Ceratodon purpureus]|uniref:Fe2OG dioxygenase domain-containing protein n=1 Tax=Ceratodon purpureus TaxID=3225 RepID=A0A8T0IH57_CERPU|nr:hypothetical protein KC19_3G015600 [Ceratodon purpureus]